MILVTGGAGYIGSHINSVLNDQGIETVVIDNLSLGHSELVIGGEFVEGDFGDASLLKKVFSRYPIEGVIHLAGSTDVDESIDTPSEYYRNNIVNTLTLMDVMKEFGVNKFIFSSTSAVYSDKLDGEVSENDLIAPICPYARSKLMIEQALEDYRIAYGFQYVVFRYFNASGADPESRVGEWHEPEVHLIPVVLDVAIGKRTDIKVFGTDYPTSDGSCVRDYIHVMDIAAAHIQAIDYLTSGGQSQIFNLGYGRGYSVLEVIEMVRRVTGKDIDAIPSGRRQGDVAVSIANSKKAFDVLGWTPEFNSLEKIIQTAWHWHQQLQAKRK